MSEPGSPREILTSHGALNLIPIPPNLLKNVRSLLTFGVIQFPQKTDEANYGIVMKCGDQELHLIKWQPPDCEARVGTVLFRLHRVMIAHALPSYQREGFFGLLLPVPYLRTKTGERTESGVAYFIAPVPQGRENEDTAPEPKLPLSEGRFGPGSMRMMTAFAQALYQSGRELGIPEQTIIGVEVRKRLALAAIVLDFMVLGSAIVCMRRFISDDDPVWRVLRAREVTEVLHMPSVPLEIGASELPLAKGARN